MELAEAPLRRGVVLPRRAEAVRVLQDGRGEVLSEDRHDAGLVVVVRDASPVVDLPRDVVQRVPGHLILGLDHSPEDAHGELEVRLVEGVRHVPPEGAELAALLDVGVEKGEGHQQLLPLGGLGAPLPGLLVDQVPEAARDVGPHPRGRLVGHLHAVLQHRDGEVRGRARGQKEPEVRVVLLFCGGELEDDLLEAPHPRLSQHAVLQENPVPVPAPLLDELLGVRALALAQRDDGQAVLVVHGLGEAQEDRGRVGPFREDEDARGAVVQVGVDLLHGRGGALGELLAQLLAHVVPHPLEQLVLPKGLEQEQPLEGGHVEAQRQGLDHGVLRVDPQLAPLGVLLRHRAAHALKRAVSLALLLVTFLVTFLALAAARLLDFHHGLGGRHEVPLELADALRVGVLGLAAAVDGPRPAQEEVPAGAEDAVPLP
mmetsp:Transcript_36912/g.82700  ORF Transcript_36912/g.82700 Transcript_36912/m.82700 type:complete len:429 (-) Transcript_36912:548-1834(-)